MIGGGGSILALPLLLYVVGMKDPHVAIGTSALAVAAKTATQPTCSCTQPTTEPATTHQCCVAPPPAHGNSHRGRNDCADAMATGHFLSAAQLRAVGQQHLARAVEALRA